MQKRTTSIKINDQSYRLEYWYHVSSFNIVYSGTIFAETEIDFNFPVNEQGMINVNDLIVKKKLFYSLLATIQNNESLIKNFHQEIDNYKFR